MFDYSLGKTSSKFRGLSVAKVIINPENLEVIDVNGTPAIRYSLVSEEEYDDINQPDFRGSFAKHRKVVDECGLFYISEDYNSWETVKKVIEEITKAVNGTNASFKECLQELSQKAFTEVEEVANHLLEYIMDSLSEKPFLAVLGGNLTDDDKGNNYLNSKFTPVRNRRIVAKVGQEELLEEALLKNIKSQIDWNILVARKNAGHPVELTMDNPKMSHKYFQDTRSSKDKPYSDNLVALGIDSNYLSLISGDNSVLDYYLGNQQTTDDSRNTPESVPAEETAENTSENTSSNSGNDDMPF